MRNGSPLERLRKTGALVRALARPRRGAIAEATIFAVVHRLALLAYPLSLALLVDRTSHSAGRVGAIAALLGVGTFVLAAAAYASSVTSARVAHGTLAELRESLLAHAIRLPVAYLDRQQVGALGTRIQFSLEGTTVALTQAFVQGVAAVALGAVIVPILFHIDTTLAAIAIGIASVFLLAVLARARRSREVFRRIQTAHAELSGALEEVLSGARVVKGAVAEARESARYADRSRVMRDLSFRSATEGARYALASEAMRGAAGAVLLYLGAAFVARGELDLGALVTFGALLAILAAPVAALLSLLPDLQRAIAVFDAAYDLLHEPAEASASSASPADARRIDGAIAVEALSFEHEPGRPVLRDVSFALDAGSVVGIIGPSGAGKTTLLELLARLRTPTAGRVLVDGRDAATLPLDEYRRHVGVVGQDVFLFDRPLRENVAFAKPNASDGEVLAACDAAHVLDLVESSPDRLATRVGERGIALSGGERQRLAIARALLPEPRILLLDEATSNIDAGSERAVRRTLSKLRGSCTTILVAHRLSTVRDADLILVLDRGRLVERGTHDELVRAGGLYRELWEEQRPDQSGDEPLAPRPAAVGGG